MKESFRVTRNYLWIPVSKEKEVKEITFWIGETQVFSFQISINPDVDEALYEFDYYTELKIDQYRGETITIEGEVPFSFLKSILQKDEVPEKTKEQACIHFAPKSGWLNDPNGLYYQNGLYHLYFQFNPFNTIWENMSWGHAVSEDLIHWSQKDCVLYPDGDGTVYSGCAILNEKELLNLPKDIPLFFYTCAGGRNNWSIGKTFNQRLAYSVDEGNTLIRQQKPVLEHLIEENRDPKVYWHEETKRYYMILYLAGYEYAIFNSEDLQQWEMTQKLTLDPCWECPDLRKVTDKEGNEKWLFWSADGYYAFCEFDGKEISSLSQIKKAYQSALPYAAQTFYGVNNRVITIPWMRTKNINCNYTGMMGMPRELTLVRMNGEELLEQKPVREYFAARKEIHAPMTCNENTAVEVELHFCEAGSAQVNVFGTVYGYHTETGLCTIGLKEIMLEKNLKELSFLIDKELVEISAREYTLYAAIETECLEQQGTICIEHQAEGASVVLYVCN